MLLSSRKIPSILQYVLFFAFVLSLLDKSIAAAAGFVVVSPPSSSCRSCVKCRFRWNLFKSLAFQKDIHIKVKQQQEGNPFLQSSSSSSKCISAVAILALSSCCCFLWGSRPAWSISQATTATNALPAHLTWKHLLLAGSLVLTTSGIGIWKAGVPNTLIRSILQACLRCTVQLHIIAGYVLSILSQATTTSPWIVGLWIILMGILAAYEAHARVEYVYPQLLHHLMVAFVGGGGSILAITNLIGILGGNNNNHLQPFWCNPRTWIPVAGMMFGNSLSVTSLAIRTITQQLAESKTDIELRLAMGASMQEAIRSILFQTYSTALTPVINALSVAGVVHIPGMMTGQILAGQSVVQAAAYQLVIFFLFTSTALATVQIITQLALQELVDPSNDQLLLKKLTQRQRQQRTQTKSNQIQQIASQISRMKNILKSTNETRKLPTYILNEFQPVDKWRPCGTTTPICEYGKIQ